MEPIAEHASSTKNQTRANACNLDNPCEMDKAEAPAAGDTNNRGNANNPPLGPMRTARAEAAVSARWQEHAKARVDGAKAWAEVAAAKPAVPVVDMAMGVATAAPCVSQNLSQPQPPETGTLKSRSSKCKLHRNPMTAFRASRIFEHTS